jgi:hypothetical protein
MRQRQRQRLEWPRAECERANEAQKKKRRETTNGENGALTREEERKGKRE